MKKASMHGPNVWVVRRGSLFSLREEGRPRYLIPPVRQYVAIAIGRLIARANESELFIQRRNGRIRARDSHGFDAYPPKG